MQNQFENLLKNNAKATQKIQTEPKNNMILILKNFKNTKQQKNMTR